jgi:predicted alpha-1,2-mannosidase
MTKRPFCPHDVNDVIQEAPSASWNSFKDRAQSLRILNRTLSNKGPPMSPSRLARRSLARTTLLLFTAGALGASSLIATSGSASADPAPVAYLADPASAVDPIIGTSGAVDDFPGADVPFGMVQWSPDTPSRPSGGGYEYKDKTVTGFSLTHISGPGCGAAGDIPILPTSGAISGAPSNATLPLDHSAEHAGAGTYSLAAGGITTKLTATARSGMAQFGFPAGADSNLLFKLSGSANGTSSTHFQIVSSTEVAGWVTSGHFCGADDEYNVYFDMTFDAPFTSNGTWKNNTSLQRGARSLNLTQTTKAAATGAQKSPTVQPKSSIGIAQPRPQVHATARASKSAAAKAAAAQPPVSGAAGAYLTFDTSQNATLQAKVGLSYVSTANAKANRVAENPGWDFDQVSTAAHASWNQLLSKIEIGGGTADEQKVFETALYHSLLHPNVYSDANGQYLGFDGQVHTTDGGHVEYANYSGWDIYRSQVQLAAMVAPTQTSDSIRSMLDQYDQTGQLPKWELNNGESYVMVGDPADPIIADAYAFGARDFDTAHALEAMQLEANQPNNIRPGLDYYQNLGYLPLDGSYDCCNFYGQVSTQQEYNTADYAISSFARALGDTDTAATFAKQANNWQNVFNPGTGYLEARYADGRFVSGFTPSTSTGFVEGTSAQYTPMEPFDIAGLAAADGGNANWISKLDALTAKIKNPGPLNADFGNEPSIEIPWEYDYVGAPDKTQGLVRQIQQQIFTTAPAGIAGNDDLGEMSSWYVFSALGFYPETPGTSHLALGSAVFPAAAIHLATGNTLTISAPNAAAANPYISSMTVNGSGWAHAYLPDDAVTAGGTVNEVLSATADPDFASAAGDAPASDSTGLAAALGYTTGSTVVIQPGATGTITIGARNLRSTAQNVTWSIASPGSLSASPSSGTLPLAANGNGTRSVTITAPATEGRYSITINFRSGTGAALPAVTTEVDVAKPGALWPYYNNAGIAADGVADSANFDGDGWAYSSQQLIAAGITPGGTITVNGIAFTMPNTKPGDLDNIEAGGQTLPVTGAGVSKIGFIGSATNASPGATTDVTVNFSDGSTETVKVGLSDWTLGGGSTTTPSYGNALAAATSYRDTTDGDKQAIKTYLFEADAALTGGQTVTSVTVPAATNSGQFHLFAIGTA